jgi:hypothetical protein
MPNEIVLIVVHVQSGGTVLAHNYEAEIVSVVVDGEERDPKDRDFGKACSWLQEKGYVPTEFRWLDRAGTMRRRRRCTYVAA